MKLNNFKTLSAVLLLATTFISCDDFLDKEPPSSVIPEDYYRAEEQIQAIANGFYEKVLPSHGGVFGIFGYDTNTDNQASFYSDGKYVPGQWKVGMDNGNWAWENIRNVNYSLNMTLDRLSKKEITGNQENIRQYIGELYFIRAYCYFTMLRSWGDLPIVTSSLPDKEEALVGASKRSPRNEVSRFIIANLDTASTYMKENFDPRRNRISLDVATLVKSRVALYEGTWLKYFKSTPFVPNGEGWPGKSKAYNANYEYPTGNIDNEINYFLTIAAESAETVAEKYKGKLTRNTGIVPQSEADQNPYFYMFGSPDLSPYPDVLLWREYNKGMFITNYVEVGVQFGNSGIGLTRSMVEGFVMKDGKPVYATHESFAYNDQTIRDVRTNADPRLHIFLKDPGQKNVFKNMNANVTHAVEIEPVPNILTETKGYSTGYAIRKGGSFDKDLCENQLSYNGAVSFRATEALLNYMEAQYELTGNIASGRILEYWKTVREVAGFTGAATNPQITISATDMKKEKLDWGSYSAGQQLTNPTLYNIRRERRCELMAEGLRWMDLSRWRACDQLMKEPYHVEGFHFWSTPMQQWYDAKQIKADGSSSANLSSATISEYIRPYERNMTSGNLFRNGYTWSMAHYLQPLPIKQFKLTSSDHNNIELSPLYQNPYWPTQPDMPAEK